MHARAYYRVSTKDQEEGASLETQAGDIDSFAARHDYVVVAEYQDVETGSRDDRGAYQRLLADVRPGEAVLAWRLDRLGRSNTELARVFDELERREVRVVFVTQPELSDNRFMRNIYAALADLELETLKARVTPNMRRRAAQGVWVSRLPRWYVRGADGHLSPAVGGKAACERFFRAFLDTRNVLTTAALEGISPGAARVALRNRAYLGEVRWKDVVVAGAHPPLIDDGTFAAANALLDGRKRDGRRERHDTALLTGFVFVGDTPQRMYARAPHAGRSHWYYITSNANLAKHDGIRRTWRADYIEAQVLNELRALTITPAVRNLTAKRLRQRAATDTYATERARLTKQLDKVQQARVNLATMHAAGDIDRATFDAGRAQQNGEETALRRALAALPPPLDMNAAIAALDLRIDLSARIDRDVAEGHVAALRTLIEGFVSRVEVYGADVPDDLRTGTRGAAGRRQADRPTPRVRVRWNEAVIDA